MQASELIEKLKGTGDLDKFVAAIDQGDQEFVTGTWYNMVVAMADDIEHQMCDVTREMWEFGLQVFDWDFMYELLLIEKNKLHESIQG